MIKLVYDNGVVSIEAAGTKFKVKEEAEIASDKLFNLIKQGFEDEKINIIATIDLKG